MTVCLMYYIFSDRQKTLLSGFADRRESGEKFIQYSW